MITNDVAAGNGFCVSFFTQGCPHKCQGCHNPETWSFDGGLEFTAEVLDKIIYALTAQGIKRDLCIMGGEPLCPQNALVTWMVIASVKEKVPDTKIYLWTGYILEELLEEEDYDINIILNQINVLIDGPYIESERDITLHLRGSRNQRILTKKEICDIIDKKESEKNGCN